MSRQALITATVSLALLKFLPLLLSEALFNKTITHLTGRFGLKNAFVTVTVKGKIL